VGSVVLFCVASSALFFLDRERERGREGGREREKEREGSVLFLLLCSVLLRNS